MCRSMGGKEFVYLLFACARLHFPSGHVTVVSSFQPFLGSEEGVMQSGKGLAATVCAQSWSNTGIGSAG